MSPRSVERRMGRDAARLEAARIIGEGAEVRTEVFHSAQPGRIGGVRVKVGRINGAGEFEELGSGHDWESALKMAADRVAEERERDGKAQQGGTGSGRGVRTDGRQARREGSSRAARQDEGGTQAAPGDRAGGSRGDEREAAAVLGVPRAPRAEGSQRADVPGPSRGIEALSIDVMLKERAADALREVSHIAHVQAARLETGKPVQVEELNAKLGEATTALCRLWALESTGILRKLRERLDEIDRDERFHYPAASVMVNAPLALIQMGMEAEAVLICRVLEIPHLKKRSERG